MFNRFFHRAIWALLIFANCCHLAASFSIWPAQSTTNRIPSCYKILILPGFGNASGDYTMEGSLVSSLKRRGWEDSQIDVLPVKRTDWLQVFLRGALDLDFWKANAPPNRPAFKWYLDRITAKVQELEENESLILIGHSAAGWLCRAAVGFGSDQDENEDGPLIDLSKIKGIVTLGAPNQPPPPGVMDMTRGALRITNEKFPGCFHAPTTFYITVIGNAIQGKKKERSSPFERTTRDGFAFESYEAVCGDGSTVGDGVVPLCAAHVEDSIQLNLDGVFHSINVPDQWYGADKILDQWHETMLSEIQSSLANKKAAPSFDPTKLFSR